MSTSNSRDSSYHHGDLRNTLINAGVELLAQEGAQSISLRKLARQIGVSHNAPYMHFADKEALLAAIAEEGFHHLTAAVDRAITHSQGDWRRQFEESCWAYVEFALEHPNHLQVMFDYFEHEKYPDLLNASTAALEQLERLIEAGQRQGQVIGGNSKRLATYTWSLLHGLGTILAGQKMPPAVRGNRSPRELTLDFVHLIRSGIETRESGGPALPPARKRRVP